MVLCIHWTRHFLGMMLNPGCALQLNFVLIHYTLAPGNQAATSRDVHKEMFIKSWYSMVQKVALKVAKTCLCCKHFFVKCEKYYQMYLSWYQRLFLSFLLILFIMFIFGAKKTMVIVSFEPKCIENISHPFEIFIYIVFSNLGDISNQFEQASRASSRFELQTAFSM